MEPNTPSFMADDLPVTRPPLNRATFRVGSKVTVIGGWGKPQEMIVRKIGRVWVTLRWPSGFGADTRFRLDDQTDGSNHGSRTRFVTPEQRYFEVASSEALVYLASQGLAPDYGSPWRGKTIKLARMIWTSEQEEKADNAPIPFTIHHMDGTVTTETGKKGADDGQAS